MDFGQAIEALKNGEMIQREGWNGKDTFVFMQVDSVIDRVIVPKMQSLPQKVKDEFEIRFQKLSALTAIYYSNQLAIVDMSNNIKGWSPSTSDSLATDWIIFK